MTYYSCFTPKRTESAFTVLEILVVIAIIASLMAIILPVFAQSRERARAQVCISNLRQIGAAVIAYSQDYDGLYPYGADPVDKYSLLWGVDPTRDPVLKDMPLISDLLVPYVGDSNVWACPSDWGFYELEHLPGPDRKPLRLKANPSAFKTFGSSYGYRTELAFRHLSINSLGYRPNGTTVGTSEILMLTDICGGWHGTKGAGLRFDVAYADGHANSLGKEQYNIAWTVNFKLNP